MNYRQLTKKQRRLLQAIHRLNHGTLEGVKIKQGEPMIDGPALGTRTVKLGLGLPEQRHLPHDFRLKRQHLFLISYLRDIQNGKISINVQDGLPIHISHPVRCA
ncbi:hypothetical protein SCOR_33110 [Sulfidibacter corallicola]